METNYHRNRHNYYSTIASTKLLLVLLPVFVSSLLPEVISDYAASQRRTLDS